MLADKWKGLGSNKKRVSMFTKSAEMGTYLHTINTLFKLATAKPTAITKADWAGSKNTLTYAIMLLITKLIIKMITFNENDDDDKGTYNYDEDYIDNFKNLKTTTGYMDIPLISDLLNKQGGKRFDADDYAKAQALRLVLGVDQELETWLPLPTFKTLKDIASFKSAGADAIVDWLDFGSAAVHDLVNEKPAEYEQAAGAMSWQESHDSKLLNLLIKKTGVTGSMLAPMHAIEKTRTRYVKDNK